METKKLDYIIRIICAVIVMILLCFVYRLVLDVKIENEKMEMIYSNIEEERIVAVDNYYIYGTHLNMEGHILKEDIYQNFNLQKLRIVLKTKDGITKEYLASLSEDTDRYTFCISSNINEGIELDTLTDYDYYIVLAKLSFSNNSNIEEKIYYLDNKSKDSNNEYYTLTKNGENNRLDIIFNDTFEIKSEKVALPDDVYDIVLDAGHGGADTGAIYNGLNEKDYTLDYTISLKEKLEALGYKVKLTRDTDTRTPSYGKNSRAETPFETHAKLILSIHLNSSNYDENDGGVEIYAPNHANLEFAKSLADNIVNMTGTGYSVNSQMRILDGVYVRTFTQKEVDDFRAETESLGYPFYETITTDTNYFFMIRETGGRITGAYTDGRDTLGSNNSYKDSNISAEGYLLELGFLNSSKEIERFNTKKNEYLDAICNSIVEKII